MMPTASKVSRVSAAAGLALLAVLFISADVSVSRECGETPEWQAMGSRSVTLRGPDRMTHTLTAKIAADTRHRAAGFQHICPSVIAEGAILFLFEHEVQPAFHMRNVHAPLDIAFIDRHGVIRDIQRMQPYVLGAREHPTYRAGAVIVAALEVRAGYFRERGIEVDRWSVAW